MVCLEALQLAASGLRFFLGCCYPMHVLHGCPSCMATAHGAASPPPSLPPPLHMPAAAAATPMLRSLLARRVFHGVAAAAYLLLPPLLTFGTAGAAYEPLFRPPPSNDFYDGMLIAVCASITLVELLRAWALHGAVHAPHLPSDHLPPSRPAARSMGNLMRALTCSTSDVAAAPELSNAFLVFEVLLPLLMGSLYCAAGAYGSGAVWLALGAALLALLVTASWPATSQVHAHCSASTAGAGDSDSDGADGLLTIAAAAAAPAPAPAAAAAIAWAWRPARKRTPMAWVYSAFLAIIAIAFLAFPVAQPWEGPPEPFVRWHPYGEAGELVWRGIFAAYALCMLWAAAEGPLTKHLLFVVYLAVSGFVHATAMLAMCLAERASGGLNG